MLIYQIALDTVMWERFHLLSLVALSLLLHLTEFFLVEKKDNGTLVLLFIWVWRGEGSKS